jgi:hypothetical protein
VSTDVDEQELDRRIVIGGPFGRGRGAQVNSSPSATIDQPE